MKGFLTFLTAIFAAALAVSFFVPLPVPTLQDFSVMYFTDKAYLNGIPIYDYPAQLSFVKPLTPANFSFLPYPYPPWYALSTLFIGLFPIQVAARVWFFLNIAMLSLAVWLLTSGWQVIPRILGIFAAIMFIPAFGLLVVGQYSAPVLLGAALFVYSARRKNPFLTAVALSLMTFKPHIGLLLFLAGFIWLIFESSQQSNPEINLRIAFARRAILLTIIAGLFLVAIGFLADPAWPLTYFQSLGRYQDIPGVQTCGLCASLSVMLVRLAAGQSNTVAAAGVGLGLALLAGFLLIGYFRVCLKDAAVLMALFSVLTLLLDPYLLNYDYVLLLLPLFWLAGRRETAMPKEFIKRPVARLALLVYFIPWLALAMGRNANITLVFAGLITFILILRTCSKSKITNLKSQIAHGD